MGDVGKAVQYSERLDGLGVEPSTFVGELVEYCDFLVGSMVCTTIVGATGIVGATDGTEVGTGAVGEFVYPVAVGDGVAHSYKWDGF